MVETKRETFVLVDFPDVGDVVLYVTHRPAAGGGVEMLRIPALVTAINEDKTLELTAFHPGADPVVFHGVAPSNGGSYGGWESKPTKIRMTLTG